MRTAFVETLIAVAERDRRVWLVTGDLGYLVLEKFAERFPDRYLNAGVAEQNMTGVAAGLALAGNVVFTYSIANFPTFRCLEQVRNDVCCHDLPVVVVAVGGGVSYASAGYTHHGVEDFAVMGALPNMAVVAPADPVETRLATAALAARGRPGYLRLGKAGEPTVHRADPAFEIGKAIVVRDGPAATLISTGGMLETTLAAADLLAARSRPVRVLSMPTVEPLDEPAVLAAARETGCVVTVEEHGPGGLGSRAGEALARAGLGVPFVPLRLDRAPVQVAGSQASLRAARGLTAEGIASAVAGARR